MLSAGLLSAAILCSGCNARGNDGSSAPGVPAAPPAAAPAGPTKYPELPEPAFHWGIKVQPTADHAARATELGVTTVRFDINWGEIEPVIADPDMTRADVTEAMIDQYAFNDPSKKWATTDKMMEEAGKRNLRPFVIVGNGFTGGLPKYANADGQLVPFTPEAGREQYLARLYLHASAVAKRYGPQVVHWQLENELNAAGYTVAWGWRQGLAWTDWTFLTDVMTTLRTAVKEHDATSTVNVNFHTVVFEWPLHVIAWKDSLDVIGLDAYPNYVFGWPVLGNTLGGTVLLARAAAPGKRIFIVETGYATKPTLQGFSDQGQVDYMVDAVASTLANGVDGFIWHTLQTSEQAGSTGVNFPFSILESVEGYYGIINADGSPKPAFLKYKEIIAAPPQ